MEPNWIVEQSNIKLAFPSSKQKKIEFDKFAV